MPAAQNRCGAIDVRSSSPIVIRPERARCNPAIALISVVLPAPLGPSTQANSAAPRSSETPHSAGAAP